MDNLFVAAVALMFMAAVGLVLGCDRPGGRK